MPVLPPAVPILGCASLPMPSDTTEASILRSTRAVATSKTVRVSAARVCPVSVPSASTIPCTKAGVLYTPPFATVFIMAVICSGVTVSAP